jgi:hypothetical protein
MDFVLFSCVSVYILAAPRYEPAVSFGFIDLVFLRLSGILMMQVFGKRLSVGRELRPASSVSL